MEIKIFRKRGGRSYFYRGQIPKGWIAIDQDGNEYETEEEADKALYPPVKKKAAPKKKAVVKDKD